MACCVIPTDHSDLQPLIDTAIPVVYTGLNNVAESGDGLVRDGGTPNTSDAYAFSNRYVEGTGCGYWEVRQFFDDEAGNETVFYVLEDEFGTANRYGWFFQNGIQPFRRSPYHGTISDFPIYYGPAGGPAAPDQVGYNVGFRFGIYYNNGTVRLYENVQHTNDTEDFIDPVSYTYAGLPTDRRWRLKVYVFPAAATAHSGAVIEALAASGEPCPSWNCIEGACVDPGDGTGTYSTLAACQAGCSVVASWNCVDGTCVDPGDGSGEFSTLLACQLSGCSGAHTAETLTFDAGEGSAYWLVPQITDSGDELRSKTIKSIRATGRLTNASAMCYGYDVGQPIIVEDLEAGTRTNTRNTTRPQVFTDTTEVTQTKRKPINVSNAVLHTVRMEGDDTGNEQRDRIDEIVCEVARQGVRR